MGGGGGGTPFYAWFVSLKRGIHAAHGCVAHSNPTSNFIMSDYTSVLQLQGCFAGRILNNCERTVELDLELENSKLNSRLTWTGDVVFYSPESLRSYVFKGLAG
jgi:hypothetical protein